MRQLRRGATLTFSMGITGKLKIGGITFSLLLIVSTLFYSQTEVSIPDDFFSDDQQEASYTFVGLMGSGVTPSIRFENFDSEAYTNAVLLASIQHFQVEAFPELPDLSHWHPPKDKIESLLRSRNYDSVRVALETLERFEVQLPDDARTAKEILAVVEQLDHATWFRINDACSNANWYISPTFPGLYYEEFGPIRRLTDLERQRLRDKVRRN